MPKVVILCNSNQLGFSVHFSLDSVWHWVKRWRGGNTLRKIVLNPIHYYIIIDWVKYLAILNFTAIQTIKICKFYSSEGLRGPSIGRHWLSLNYFVIFTDCLWALIHYWMSEHHYWYRMEGHSFASHRICEEMPIKFRHKLYFPLYYSTESNWVYSL